MADQDRELALKITANAEQAKAELQELQQAEQGLVTTSTEATAATAGSATAIKGVGDAAEGSADQVDGASDTLSDLGSTATVAGLAQQKLSTATTATAGAVQAATGIVEKNVAAETADAAATNLAAVSAEKKAVAERAEAAATVASTGITEKDTVAEIGNTAATESSVNAHAAQALANKAAGAAIAGHELSVSKLATGLIKIAAPALGFVTVIALLPQLFRLVIDKTTEWSKSIGDHIAGLDKQNDVVRKAGETTEAYTARVNEVLDAESKRLVTNYAMQQGVIAFTKDLSVADAEMAIHKESLRAGAVTAEDLAAAYKKLGFEVSDALSLEETHAKIKTFFEAYKVELDKGEFFAQKFVEANKGHLKDWMDTEKGTTGVIDQHLQQLADKYGVVTDEQKKAVEQAKELAEAWNILTPAAKAAIESQQGFLGFTLSVTEAMTASKVAVEHLANGMDRIVSIAPSLVEQTANFVVPLKDIAGAAGAADAATSKLFSTQLGESKLNESPSSGSGTGLEFAFPSRPARD